MNLKIQSDDQQCLLSVSGALKRDMVDKAKLEIQPCLDPCKQRVVLDLSEVDCLDSSGIGLLISIYGESRSKKFEFIVVRPRHLATRTLLDFTRLDRIIRFVDNLQEVQGGALAP